MKTWQIKRALSRLAKICNLGYQDIKSMTCIIYVDTHMLASMFTGSHSKGSANCARCLQGPDLAYSTGSWLTMATLRFSHLASYSPMSRESISTEPCMGT